MTTETRPQTARDRGRRLTSLAGISLIALLSLWMALYTSALASAASPAHLHCDVSAATSPACARSAAVAPISEEGEEPEEELEEGSEEAASAEAEAEEAEAGTDSSSTSGTGYIVLSHLQLTARATAALAHRLPSVSAIGFSFTLSAPTRVQVTIVRQTSTSGRAHWAALPDSLTLSVARGHTARSLRGHNRLSPGRYRLTVKPAVGRARSIYLSARR